MSAEAAERALTCVNLAGLPAACHRCRGSLKAWHDAAPIHLVFAFLPISPFNMPGHAAITGATVYYLYDVPATADLKHELEVLQSFVAKWNADTPVCIPIPMVERVVIV